MSTHQALVVPVKLEEHPNADSLSLVQVFGWTVCVRTEDWKGADRGIYIEPDTVVPTNRPQFKFLDRGDGSNTERIRARRFRGIISFGLLVPSPEDAKIGNDYWEKLGLTRYEPPEPMSTGGDNEKAPKGFHPVYDVESFEKYFECFKEGEIVVCTEKIHGSSGRFLFDENRNKLCAGSRKWWKAEDPKSIWWKALGNHPEIREFCRNHPEITVYGEVYGQVQKLKYGIPNTCKIAVFDLLHGTEWVSYQEAHDIAPELPWVPTIFKGPFDFKYLKMIADGKSLLPKADNIREGIVIKPLKERTDPRIGRVQAKIISANYLLGKK